MNMEECVFCRIVAGEIPSYKIFESRHAMAFLDVMPAAEGHSLVIPKKHFETLTDAPETELKEVIAAVQKIARAIMKATNSEGFNVLQSNNRAAGQVVQHLHFHVIPRKQGDGLSFRWEHKRLLEKDAETLLEKTKKLLQ